MALRTLLSRSISALFKSRSPLSSLRYSSCVPVDDVLSGLTSEQIQVSPVLPVIHTISPFVLCLYVVERDSEELL